MGGQERRFGPTTKAARIAQRKRRQRVRDMLERGFTNQSEIATRLGVTQTTIASDVKAIENLWLQYDIRTTKWKRSKRVKQFERTAREAMAAFERSQQNAEEITTIYTPQKCPDCNGSGFAADEIEWCEMCKGTGKVTAEVVTRKVKGQAGDSSFLKAFNDSIKEIVKIEGLIPKESLVVKGAITHEYVNTLSIDWSKVPDEALLEVKRIWARITNQPPSLEMDAKVVEDDDGK